MFNPYWTTYYGHQSTIQLHNNLVDKPVSVRPVLLSQQGARTELPLVTLGPLANASIDVAQALAAIGRPDLRVGSSVFEYMHPYGGALIAETTVTDAQDTLAYTVIGGELGAKGRQLHGVYWFPPHGVGEIYLALQNTSRQTIQASARLGDARQPFASLTLLPNESRVVEVEIPEDNAVPGRRTTRSGSVVVTHDAPEGTLYTSGWIEIEESGYSNMMTLADPALARGNSLNGTQVFLKGAANAFDSRALRNVDSYLVLANTSGGWITPRAELVFESRGQLTRLPLLARAMAPGSTAEIELSGYSIPPDAAVGAISLKYDGQEGALMGRVFGLAGGTFGYYSTLDGYAAGSISEVYWTTSSDSLSLLTVTNFGTENDQVNVTVTYPGGTLELPAVPLQPLQSTTINLRELKRRGVLPARAEFGGFGIRGKSMIDSKLVAKEHIISELAQTSAPYYGSVTYATYYEYDCSDSVLPVGQYMYCDQILHWSNSTTTADGGSYGPDSSNGSIAGVSSYGTYFSVNGYAPGTVTISGYSSTVHVDSSGFNYDELYAQVGVVSCDFTITPSSFSGVNCNASTLNNKGFQAVISPGAFQCLLNSSGSSCTASRHSDNIDFADPACSISVINGVSATGTAHFYAGPPLNPPNAHIAGKINTSMTLKLGSRTLGKNWGPLEAVCQ